MSIITPVEAFRTSDGSLHPTIEAAAEHECRQEVILIARRRPLLSKDVVTWVIANRTELTLALATYEQMLATHKES